VTVQYSEEYKCDFGELTNEPEKVPCFSVKRADVCADNSLRLWGGVVDPTIVARVRLIMLDTVCWLDYRSLAKIIAPAMAEVDGWVYTDPVEMYGNLLNKWDSWFRGEDCGANQQFKWWYGGTNWGIYGGGDINYIVGGYAFAHYNIPLSEAWDRVAAWKRRRYHWKADDPQFIPVWYWFQKGYHLPSPFKPAAE
jgi:hypothetical protein